MEFEHYICLNTYLLVQSLTLFDSLIKEPYLLVQASEVKASTFKAFSSARVDFQVPCPKSNLRNYYIYLGIFPVV